MRIGLIRIGSTTSGHPPRTRRPVVVEWLGSFITIGRSKENAVTNVTAKFAALDPARATSTSSSPHILSNWRFWLALATVAVIAGAASNWSWLIAVGIAPILITLLPCAVMCALGLCLMKKAGADCKSPHQETPDRAAQAHQQGPST